MSASFILTPRLQAFYKRQIIKLIENDIISQFSVERETFPVDDPSNPGFERHIAGDKIDVYVKLTIPPKEKKNKVDKRKRRTK
jgi:hypothetical protein